MHFCMNWSAISFDWNHIRAFLATAEEGSLSAAARVLKQSQPTLSRQITALEEELGVVLFERVGRGLALAPAGQDLLTHVRAMAEAAGRVSLVATGRSEAIEGVVSVTASDTVSAYLLPEMLKGLREIAPGITLDIIAANDLRDLQWREADIAIRHVRPEQADLIARRLRDSQGMFFASPSYVQARGRPTEPDDLLTHDMIGFQPVEMFIGYMQSFGLPITEHQIKVMTENGLVSWELARAGFGIAVTMREVAEKFPEMERLLPMHPPIEIPVWLTCHRELHTAKRIRLVFDYLAEAWSASR